LELLDLVLLGVAVRLFPELLDLDLLGVTERVFLVELLFLEGE